MIDMSVFEPCQKPECVTRIGLVKGGDTPIGIVEFARSGGDAKRRPHGFWMGKYSDQALKSARCMDDAIDEFGVELAWSQKIENKDENGEEGGVVFTGYVIGDLSASLPCLGRVKLTIDYGADGLNTSIDVEDGVAWGERSRVIDLRGNNDAEVVDALAQVIGEAVSVTEELEETWSDDGVMVGGSIGAINKSGNTKGWGSVTGNIIRMARSSGAKPMGSRPTRLGGQSLLSF